MALPCALTTRVRGCRRSSRPWREEIRVRNRENLAWAAGLFEGEGSFSAGLYSRKHLVSGATRKYQSIQANLRMTDEDVVRRFGAIVGVGSVHGPYHHPSPTRPNVKPFWMWQAAGFQQVQAIIAMLWAWLGCRRRDRAAEVLQFARTNRRAKTQPVQTECGSNSKYRRGCRCVDCRTAHTIAARKPPLPRGAKV